MISCMRYIVIIYNFLFWVSRGSTSRLTDLSL